MDYTGMRQTAESSSRRTGRPRIPIDDAPSDTGGSLLTTTTITRTTRKGVGPRTPTDNTPLDTGGPRWQVTNASPYIAGILPGPKELAMFSGRCVTTYSNKTWTTNRTSLTKRQCTVDRPRPVGTRCGRMPMGALRGSRRNSARR